MFRRRTMLLAVAVFAVAGTGAVGQAAPRTSRGILWGRAENGLRLGISADDNALVLHIENVGSEAINAVSHVDSGGTQLDCFQLELVTPEGTRRTIVFAEDHGGAAANVVTLEPGAKFSHTVDLVEWSGRSVNDSKPLAAGLYFITANYEVPAGNASGVWTGKVTFGPVKHQIKPGS